MNDLTGAFFKLGPARVFAALGVLAVVAALFFTIVFRMGGEEKALLFADVDMKDAGAITAKLEQADIAYELRGDGGAIYVPRSKVLSARMMLSADGLPSRGSVGYELFDKPDALGATQFMQNINRLRALEGELARSIASLDGVESARVHLVLPERQLFQREAEQPSASIVLKVVRDAPSSGEVRAIRNLVASATPGLSADKVTILDDSGRLLAAAEAEGAEGSGEAMDERQAQIEDRIRKVVQNIVEGVVGPGAARVQVSAELDLNRVEQQQEIYDPEGRVVRSTQSVEDVSSSEDREARSGVSAANNLPDGAPRTETGPDSRDSANRTEETVNYEISKTTRREIIEGGRIRKLSVAVAVDGVVTPGANGAEPSYAPRSSEEMRTLTALVRSAVGYDEARGDKVEVVNARFARAPVAGVEAKKPGLLAFRDGDVMRGAEIGAAFIAALALIIFVLRPLVSGLIGGGKQAAGTGEPAGGLALASAAAGAPAASGLPLLSGATPESVIDVARIHGQVKASSVKKVAEVVEQHPEESVSILRNWLNEAL